MLRAIILYIYIYTYNIYYSIKSVDVNQIVQQKGALSVDDHGVKLTKERKSGEVAFSRSTLKNGVQYFEQICYFKLGNTIFGQTTGIPMDLDLASAQYLANLLLNYYESRWIR